MASGNVDSLGVNLIKFHWVAFVKTIKPMQITPHLSNILTFDEMRIITELEVTKREASVQALLESLLSCRCSDWFHVFKNALKEAGYEQLWKLMNLENIKDKTRFEKLISRNLLDIVRTINPIELLPMLRQLNALSDSDAQLIDADCRNHGVQHGSMILLFVLPYKTESWFSSFIKALRHGKYEELVKQIDERLPNAVSDLSVDRLCSHIRGEASFTAADESDNSRSTIIQPKVIKQTLELREYQKELMEDALTGKNCLIYAPTGTGKTCVAIAITQHHFDKATNGADEPKIAFIVDEVILVDQQLNAFRQFLQGNWNCKGLSGDTEESKVPLKDILSLNDVLVMTPRMLLNALEKKDIDSLGVFSLIIFDECHHTTKKHAYNRVMGEFYIDILLSDSGSSVKTHLPQVIGLTASLGVGKASGIEEATENILKICASLAASCLSIVRRNVDELEKYTNKPEDRTYQVTSRQDDKFRKVVTEMMQDIEEYIRCQDLTKVEKEIPDIKKLLTQSRRQTDESYRNFLNQLKHGVALVDDTEFKRVILSCHRHLEIYNTALIINEDCRTEDALNYIVEQMECVSKVSVADKWLKRIYSGFEDTAPEPDREMDEEPPPIPKAVIPPRSHSPIDNRNIIGQNSRPPAAPSLETNPKQFLTTVASPPTTSSTCDMDTDLHDADIAEESLILDLREDCGSIDVPERGTRSRDSGERSDIRNFRSTKGATWNSDRSRSNRRESTRSSERRISNSDGSKNNGRESINSTLSIPDSSVPEKRTPLQKLSVSKQQENPKLQKLKECILRCYQKDEQSQGIVFCKTREMTTALVNWVKSDRDMKKLNPGIFKGTQRSGADSFTRAKLGHAVEQFKTGHHKLMFATTVAEEGLDFSNCRYVIRYENLRASSMGRTQARGRARAEDAKYELASDPARGNVTQDEANIRGSITFKALEKVYDMPREDFTNKIHELQKCAQVERSMARKEAELQILQRQQRNHYGEYELICWKCDKHATWSTDLRTLQKNHHVVIGDEFLRCVKLEPHPDPKSISCGKKKHKLLCKKCGSDWGNTVTSKGVLYYILKIRSFIIIDPNQKKATKKNWKDVEFPIAELSADDMQAMCGQTSEDGNELGRGEQSYSAAGAYQSDLSGASY